MRKLFGGLVSWAVAALWWIMDRLWGDAVYAAVRPTIPDWLADASQAWRLAMDWGVSYGPPAAFLTLGVYFFWSGRRAIRGLVRDSAAASKLPVDDFPDLRVADNRFASTLFESPRCDRLLPLLEAHKLSAWGRPIGPGEPPLTAIPGHDWKTHALHSVPATEQWSRNQTFLKTKNSQETKYYDVHLNKEQINRIWTLSRADIVRELDDLYAQGVSFRNYFEASENTEFAQEFKKFTSWNERVISVLDTFSVADKSRFRTLNRFRWKYTERAENEPQRKYLEAIWNEKLDRLSATIKESGA